jgi:hypothetical protein
LLEGFFYASELKLYIRTASLALIDAATMTTLSRTLTVLTLLATAFIASSTFATTHVISFGGAEGAIYAPNNLMLAVGDVVVWQGDFASMPLHFDEVPPGAILPADITTGVEFRYNIRKGGIYRFSSPAGASGMFGAAAEIVSVNDDASERYLSIFPNPVSNELHVKLADPNAVVASASLIDLSGCKRTLLPERTAKDRIKFDIESLGLSPGIYLFELILDSRIIRRKLIISR